MQMEDSYLPKRLDDFCSIFNISLFDVHLPCIFCGYILDLQQLGSFYQKQLSLVWRSGACFACCVPCSRLSARYEAERFYRCSVKGIHFEDFLRKNLADVVCRCYECMSLLDLPEKLDCIFRGECFHLVRNTWRGTCRNCCRK
ncbi:E6 protein [Human papillomavirus 88]|uniref:Protein E6 n=1 Tax=Human papillomavirus 88 TaxID=337054 RepID=A8R8M7_9PAPI|nr:E6 protein [Human papillomavirus type 88]ABR20502.1 E6 protein [Human papillomavirus type 88]